MCRGRRIGFTDLGFARWDESARAGWFFPDSDADAAEGLDPANRPDLELRGPDGSIVPTEWIGIQDTEAMIARARDYIDRWDPDDDTEELLEDECATYEACWSPEMDEDDAEFDAPEWPTAEDEVDFPRYQILLGLAEPNAIE